LILAGYDRDFELLASTPAPPGARPAATRIAVRRAPGLDAVAVDRTRATVSVASGVRLDLGATAKALAADRAAAAAHRATGAGVLVSLGGDMAMAGEPPPGDWQVRVTDDHAAGVAAPGQSISLRSGGLATSSTQVRR